MARTAEHHIKKLRQFALNAGDIGASHRASAAADYFEAMAAELARLRAESMLGAVGALRRTAKLWRKPASELTEQELDERLVLGSTFAPGDLASFPVIADWLEQQAASQGQRKP